MVNAVEAFAQGIDALIEEENLDFKPLDLLKKLFNISITTSQGV